MQIRERRKSLINFIDEYTDHIEDPNFTLVEVGVSEGLTMVEFCQLPKLFKYIGVDPWQHYENPPDNNFQNGLLDASMDRWAQEDFDNQYLDCLNKLKAFPKETMLIRDFSHLACKEILDESVNFVFIDGAHQKEYVLKDIECWLPKLKRGGIMMFDDWSQTQALANPRDGKNDEGPYQALAEYSQKNKVTLYQTADNDYVFLQK